MRQSIIWLIFVAAMSAMPTMAAPFLTADPYPTTAAQPDRFDFLFDAATVPVSSPAMRCDAAAVSAGICASADNSMVMRHDVGTLVKGSHTVTAKACNISSCSASSASLSFSTAVPVAPAGLRLIP